MNLLLIEADPLERHRLLTELQTAVPGVSWSAAATPEAAGDGDFTAVVLRPASLLHVVAQAGEVTANIAHELNNILTPIQLALDLMREAKTEEARRALEELLQANIERGAAAVQRLFAPPRRADVATVVEPTAGGGELILVIDDEEQIRNLARATLEAFNYRVLTAGDGAQGVALFSAHRGEIRAVVTDMMMPVMDGPATIQALRNLDPLIPVIGVSALSAPDLGDLAHMHFQAFLRKPYAARTLLETLHTILRM